MTHRSTTTTALAGALGVLTALAACHPSQAVQPPAPQMPSTSSTNSTNTMTAMNTLTDAQRAEGWRLLFDGRTTDGWRGYHSESVPTGWKVEDGVLTKSVSTDDIITTDQFGDFELDLDWKISRAGNAGIFYRATEQYDHIYWSAPEYQLLDDANAPDGKRRITSAGSDYALYPSPAGIVKPAGEWNSTRIIVKGAHVEHWMNGHKLLEYELWSPDWQTRVKASKFAAWPNYGLAKTGYIGFQGDHDGTLSLRNIRIRELH